MSNGEINTPGKRQSFVHVKDKAGNEFVCPVDALKDPKDVSEEELKACFDDARIAVEPGG
ncbi:MAG: hypothetical protein R6V10_12930 [bacterium]